MGKLLHQLQLLRESSPGWAQPPQTHSPTDFCQNRISYLSHICHDKTRNSSVSLRLEKGKEVFAKKPGPTSKLPNTQSPPGQLFLVSYLRYVWFLFAVFHLLLIQDKLRPPWKLSCWRSLTFDKKWQENQRNAEDRIEVVVWANSGHVSKDGGYPPQTRPQAWHQLYRGKWAVLC